MNIFRRRKPVKLYELCQHQWKPVGASFTPPSDRGFTYTGFYPEQTYDLMYGFTNITQQCQVPGCGKIKVVKARGRADVPGFTWQTRSSLTKG